MTCRITWHVDTQTDGQDAGSNEAIATSVDP